MTPVRPIIASPQESPATRAVRDHWLALAAGRPMPAWHEFDPVAVPRLLRHLVVVQVTHAPLAFRYRLIGTYVTAIAGRDATGRALDETLYGDRLEAILWSFRRVATTGQPVASIGHVNFSKRDWIATEHVFLPFGPPGGPVDIILSGLDRRDGDPRLAAVPSGGAGMLDWRG